VPRRQWYTLSINGERVGYGYDDWRRASEGTVFTRVMRVEVTQLRQRSVVETRLEIRRGPDGVARQIHHEAKAGVEHSRWDEPVRAGMMLPDRPTPGQPSTWEQRFLGANLVWEPCAKDCDASVAHPFDPMAAMVVQSPFRVPRSALAGPIRYVIARPAGGAPRLAVTGEQAVAWDGERAVVTICSTCGVTETLAEADRQRYLAPNAWVQSDAWNIRAFAKRHAGRGTPEQKMSRLVQGVINHMTGNVDYLGYATALDALRTRSGDCTEFAVLLAAAARASGIPARIAVGLVYSDRFSGKKDVFSPHMWVQAWNGTQWISYDAGLGSFDATHIALALGDGNPRNMDAVSQSATEYRIDKLGLVKR
jgi:hypothetical protein